jgi:hypothetical protein
MRLVALGALFLLVNYPAKCRGFGGIRGGRSLRMSGVGFTYDEAGPMVVWTASKSARRAVNVVPGARPLKDYLALPPTEYSLLDPSTVQRINEDEFLFSPGQLKLLGSIMEPRVFLRVIVDPAAGCARICVERVEMGGSPLMASTNGHFNCSSTTLVRQGVNENGEIELLGDVDLFIEVAVPKENWFPVRLIQKAGNFLMQQIVFLGTPTFVRFLAKDYERWSQGDDSRSAVVDEGQTLLSVGSRLQEDMD